MCHRESFSDFIIVSGFCDRRWRLYLPGAAVKASETRLLSTSSARSEERQVYLTTRKTFAISGETTSSPKQAGQRLQGKIGERADASKSRPHRNEIPAEIATGALIPFGIAKIGDRSCITTGHSQR